jgi:hypothetical protein
MKFPDRASPGDLVFASNKNHPWWRRSQDICCASIFPWPSSAAARLEAQLCRQVVASNRVRRQGRTRTAAGGNGAMTAKTWRLGDTGEGEPPKRAYRKWSLLMTPKS